MQDNFTGNTLDYLILPLIASQLKSAVGALNTVNERQGLVRTRPMTDGSVRCKASYTSRIAAEACQLSSVWHAGLPLHACLLRTHVNVADVAG